ncbi:MAG: glutaminyl-peptide cyclotransferase [Bacteroidota bacterium]
MKKYIIIGLLLLTVAAMVFGPMLSNSNAGSTAEDLIPAEFTFKENLATSWNKIVPIEIKINDKTIEKLELVYNDSVFQTWSKPQGKIQYQFNAGFYGLGTRTLELRSTTKDGEEFIDNRFVRVLSDVPAEVLSAKIAAEFPHKPTSFTQGLEFNDGVLFESTGQKGTSIVAHVELNSGSIKKEIGLDGNYFGEGITVLGDKVYQLTWQEQKCFFYDKKSLQLLGDFNYTGEGWGLCNDGKNLIMSDGTERLTIRDPKTFQIIKTIEVYDQKGPITKLNELEFIDGKIYANVWMTNSVIVIQPENGKVLSIIDCSALVAKGRGAGGDVLNGIAHNKGKIYMTGKNWSKLFEVKVEKL